MATCLLNNNLTKDTQCGYALKQIVEIYLANFSQVTSVTVGTDKQEVTNITMAASSSFFKIEPAANSATWSDNLGIGGNGAKYRVHQIGFSFAGSYDADMVDNVDALSLGKFLAVCRMSDGSFVMFGRLSGLEATDADAVTNSGSGDATAESGLTVTLTGNTTESVLPLTEEAIKVVLGTKD